MAKPNVVKITEPTPTLYEAGGEALARLRITVVGITPLLTHNPASMSLPPKPGSKESRIPTPEDEAEAGVYRLDDGTCAVKGDAFRACILRAAGAWKTKNRGTMKSQLAHIVVFEELVPLLYLDGTPIKDYVIDRRPVVVGKARIIRSRPRFDNWMARPTIGYEALLVSNPKMIVDILADGGSRIGIGDYNPLHNGPMGRFRPRDYLIEDNN